MTASELRTHADGLLIERRWRIAYGAALSNALLFLLLSLFTYLAGPTGLLASTIVAGIFFAGSLACYFLFVRAGMDLGAVSYYVLGTGIFFGFGALVAVLFGNPQFQTFFSDSQQAALFAKANLVNALSILIVLAVAMRWTRPLARSASGEAGITRALDAALPYRSIILVGGLALVVVTIYMSFPLPSNRVLQTLLSLIGSLGSVVIVYGAAQWFRLSMSERLVLVTLTLLSFLYGIAGFGKTASMLPIAAFVVGLILERKSRVLLVATVLVAAISYFTVIAPVCNAGRLIARTNAQATFLENLETARTVLGVARDILAQASGDMASDMTTALLGRFGIMPIQAFLIYRHDTGLPGDSLNDAWQALIPRILWPDKPIIGDVAKDVDAIYFNADRPSLLAPSYSGEAYWNYGWLGVILVSILLGLEVGWLTRQWNLFVAEGLRRIGVLMISTRALFAVFWVETGIVGSYVGGFVTILVLILITNWVVASLFPVVNPPSGKLSPAG